MSNSKKHILLGKVLRVNGLNGEVILKLSDAAALNKIQNQVFVKVKGDESMAISYNVGYFKVKNSLEVTLKLKEVADAMQARTLEGKKIYVYKEMLIEPDIETVVEKANYLKHKRNAPVEI